MQEFNNPSNHMYGRSGYSKSNTNNKFINKINIMDILHNNTISSNWAELVLWNWNYFNLIFQLNRYGPYAFSIENTVCKVSFRRWTYHKSLFQQWNPKKNSIKIVLRIFKHLKLTFDFAEKICLLTFTKVLLKQKKKLLRLILAL